MLDDLTKNFFDTFGIEHEERYYNCKDNLEGKCGIKCPCECCDKSEEVYCYPQITDNILLNLVLIMNPFGPPIGANLEEFKQHILEMCIGKATDIKHQVQAIFKGER